MTRPGFWHRVTNIRDWRAITLAYTLLGLGGGLLFISGLTDYFMAGFYPSEGPPPGWLYFLEIGPHLIRDLGIASVVAGLLGVGYDKLLRKTFLDDVSTRVEDIFRGPQFRKQGLENMYGSLTWGIIEEKFDDLIDKAPGLIARAQNDQEKPKIRKPFELRPLAIEVWLPENYGPFSTVRQPTPAQLFSACKRVARVVDGLLGSKELWSS